MAKGPMVALLLPARKAAVPRCMLSPEAVLLTIRVGLVLNVGQEGQGWGGRGGRAGQQAGAAGVGSDALCVRVGSNEHQLGAGLHQGHTFSGFKTGRPKEAAMNHKT